MLAGPDRVKAERTNKAHLLQRFGETTGRIIAYRVLRVQVDAKLQCRAPAIVPCSGDDGITSIVRDDSEMARTGVAGCCPYAASGHAATPRRPAMNSRRRIPCQTARSCTAATAHLFARHLSEASTEPIANVVVSLTIYGRHRLPFEIGRLRKTFAATPGRRGNLATATHICAHAPIYTDAAQRWIAKCFWRSG